MDEGFIGRVLKTSAVVGPLFALCAYACLGPLWSFSFLLAAGWSIANLWALKGLLKALVLREGLLKLGSFFFLKVPILYGVILFYLIAVPWKASALITGFSLPYVVIVLKVLGRALVETMGEAPRGTRRNVNDSHKGTK